MPSAVLPADKAPPGPGNGQFDVVAAYHQLLSEDSDLTMPVAAMQSLVLGLRNTPSSTASETLNVVSKLTEQLKRSIPNSISLSAGTDIFQQYLMKTLGGTGDFDKIHRELVQNSDVIVANAKAARQQIAAYGKKMVKDGSTILTLGGSRVVGALLKSAAEPSNASGGGSSIRFRVIYVMSADGRDAESTRNIAALRELNIPVTTIPPSAVAFCLDQVTQCIVGAEGVVENGGIISRIGTYQCALLAKATNKPFYVLAESHKFVRLFPLGQQDLGIQQNVMDFKTAKDLENDSQGEAKEGQWKLEDAVDYTPPSLISCIITESGVKMPGAVSEQLIEMYS